VQDHELVSYLPVLRDLLSCKPQARLGRFAGRRFQKYSLSQSKVPQVDS
jgi:hypothetical protein